MKMLEHRAVALQSRQGTEMQNLVRRCTMAAVLLVLLGVAGLAWGKEPYPQPAFPLRVSENSRYLVDHKGRPFFLQGDSSWELLWRLNRAETMEFLEARRQQGFNTLIVNILPFTTAGDHHLRKNRAGELPFTTPADFSAPNEKYFAHLDWLVQTTADRGFQVLLVPFCLCLGKGVWYADVKRQGSEACYRYGRYLGRRYHRFPNVGWVLGEDRDPGDVIEHIRALARGLKETAPSQLRTYHPGPTAGSSAKFFHHDAWLDLNLTYAYRDTYSATYQDYERTPVKPTFLGESAYEAEKPKRRDSSPKRMRTQAYWTILAGSCGHFYGSKAQGFAAGWQKELQVPGGQHMAHVRRFFESYPWFRLVPERGHRVVTDGYEADQTLATTAWIPDGSLAVTYLPTRRALTVDLSRFKGAVTAKWYDPTQGSYRPETASPFTNSGSRRFTPPQHNAAGDADFVLVLEARPGR